MFEIFFLVFIPVLLVSRRAEGFVRIIGYRFGRTERRIEFKTKNKIVDVVVREGIYERVEYVARCSSRYFGRFDRKAGFSVQVSSKGSFDLFFVF